MKTWYMIFAAACAVAMPAPPVAYSGDDWKGDLTKASTITFTPPEGSGLEPTTWNKTGRGASAFTFSSLVSRP